MKITPLSLQRLIQEFNKLPGIGTVSSERFVYFLLRQPPSAIDALITSLQELRQKIRTCTRCYNYSEEELCAICRDATRHHHIICVVAEPKDVVVLENTGEFCGVYHVLGGVINPAEGIGPQQLHIAELLRRVKADGATEIILATNPDIEGDTTALYITQQLQDSSVKITKIARGLPTGAALEFADADTLRHALSARQPLIRVNQPAKPN